MQSLYYKRHLPHYHHEGYPLFITFRLANSLPKSVISKLKIEQDDELKKISAIPNVNQKYAKYSAQQKLYFAKFDNLLDGSTTGPRWLNKKDISNIIKKYILSGDHKFYNLIAFTIMPNHVHILFIPIFSENNDINLGEVGASPYKVTRILQTLKMKTAIESNKILKRKGQFWQHESYDHVARNEEEAYKITKYILNNPVKAGLVEKWSDWDGSYFNPTYFT